MIRDVPDEELGSIAMAAPVPRLSATPGSIRSSGGRIGRDTVAVLRDELGITNGEFDDLVSQGVISFAADNANAGEKAT
jgi:crotonobetainyl-CoA:carnitine CoA-transferase CaiB-like acyl-CoA transferase